VWHCIVGLLEVHEHHVGWLSHNPSALYDLHNTGHLSDAFFSLAKAGLSPTKQATIFCSLVDASAEDHTHHFQNCGHERDPPIIVHVGEVTFLGDRNNKRLGPRFRNNPLLKREVEEGP
jgi:hypothetical protein